MFAWGKCTLRSFLDVLVLKRKNFETRGKMTKQKRKQRLGCNKPTQVFLYFHTQEHARTFEDDINLQWPEKKTIALKFGFNVYVTFSPGSRFRRNFRRLLN